MRKYKARTTLVCTGLWLHKVTDFVYATSTNTD